MKVFDIYEKIDWYYPFLTACDFDNVGLLVGDKNTEVTSAVVALDCTNDVVDFAVEKGANVIVTHHPVIFNPLKSIEGDSVVYKLIKHGIAVISAHTNLDTGENGVNDCLCSKMGIKVTKSLMIDGLLIRTGETQKVTNAKELALRARDSLLATRIRFTDGGKPIKKVAVCSGGGGSLLKSVMASGADAFVTGEVKHSDFIAAKNAGFTIIECGHFESENIIVPYLTNLLKKVLPEIKFNEYTTSAINYI